MSNSRSREGAWIEIRWESGNLATMKVAPVRERGLKYCTRERRQLHDCRSREGAWIEILWKGGERHETRVAPVRERGLKCSPLLERLWPYGVAPVRERGLKY